MANSIDQGVIKSSISNSRSQEESSNIAAQVASERAISSSGDNQATQAEIIKTKAEIARVGAEIDVHKQDLENPPKITYEKKHKARKTPFMPLYAARMLRAKFKNKNQGPDMKTKVDEKAVKEIQAKIKKLSVEKVGLEAKLESLKQSNNQSSQKVSQSELNAQSHRNNAAKSAEKTNQLETKLETGSEA